MLLQCGTAECWVHLGKVSPGKEEEDLVMPAVVATVTVPIPCLTPHLRMPHSLMNAENVAQHQCPRRVCRSRVQSVRVGRNWMAAFFCSPRGESKKAASNMQLAMDTYVMNLYE